MSFARAEAVRIVWEGFFSLGIEEHTKPNL